MLVTGATGFVGTALCDALPGAGFRVRRVVRHSVTGQDDVSVGTMSGATDWSAALDGVDAVVHLAARTHVLRDRARDPLDEYRNINVEATRALAEAAASQGIRRFVFLSSVKVNGEATHGVAFRESDPPQPEDAYGVTKLEAEELLRGMPLDSVILRPPLVYGPRVKGNFRRLMDLVDRGVPLPLSSIQNRRSLLYVGNLVDAIIVALRAPPNGSRTYLVADREAPSTPTLIRSIAGALGTRARLTPCPTRLLRIAGAVTGKSGEVARLTGSLEVDATRIGEELGWSPRFSIDQGLGVTARWYHAALGARPHEQ